MYLSPQQIYADICTDYFPRWRHWAQVYNPGLFIHGQLGYCNYTEKKIGRSLPIKHIFIHEICYAVSTKNMERHGKPVC